MGNRVSILAKITTVDYAQRFCEPAIWTRHSRKDDSLLYLASSVEI